VSGFLLCVKRFTPGTSPGNQQRSVVKEPRWTVFGYHPIIGLCSILSSRIERNYTVSEGEIHHKGNVRFHPSAEAQGFPAPEIYNMSCDLTHDSIMWIGASVFGV